MLFSLTHEWLSISLPVPSDWEMILCSKAMQMFSYPQQSHQLGSACEIHYRTRPGGAVLKLSSCIAGRRHSRKPRGRDSWKGDVWWSLGAWSWKRSPLGRTHSPPSIQPSRHGRECLISTVKERMCQNENNDIETSTVPPKAPKLSTRQKGTAAKNVQA